MSTVKTNNVQVGQSGTATNNFTLYQPATPDGTVRLGVGNSGATTGDVVTVTNAGNVGIGTSSPNKSSSNLALTVNAALGQYPAIELSTGNTGRWYINADATNVYDTAMNSTNRTFYTGGSERMRITSAGDVGIGTSSTEAKLHVSSTLDATVMGSSSYAAGPSFVLSRVTANAGIPGVGLRNWTPWTVGKDTGQIRFDGLTSTSAYTEYAGIYATSGTNTSTGAPTSLFFKTSDGTATAIERVRIDSSGNVGIGTVTNNVFDAVAAARPLVVQSASSSTTLNGSTNSLTICNSDTTTNNISQINFAAITGANTAQYSSATISAIHGARVNGQYPAGQLSFATSTATNNAPSEKMRIGADGQQSSVIPGNATLYNEYKCRAWVNFNGTGTVAIRASGNVSSITDSNTGQYTINFTTSMPDANYTSTYAVNWDNGSAGAIASIDAAPTASGVRFRTGYGYFTAVDVVGLYVAVFR